MNKRIKIQDNRIRAQRQNGTTEGSVLIDFFKEKWGYFAATGALIALLAGGIYALGGKSPSEVWDEQFPAVATVQCGDSTCLDISDYVKGENLIQIPQGDYSIFFVTDVHSDAGQLKDIFEQNDLVARLESGDYVVIQGDMIDTKFIYTRVPGPIPGKHVVQRKIDDDTVAFYEVSQPKEMGQDKAVIKFLQAVQEQHPQNLVVLRGNHEEIAVQYYKRIAEIADRHDLSFEDAVTAVAKGLVGVPQDSMLANENARMPKAPGLFRSQLDLLNFDFVTRMSEADYDFLEALPHGVVFGNGVAAFHAKCPLSLEDLEGVYRGRELDRSSYKTTASEYTTLWQREGSCDLPGVTLVLNGHSEPQEFKHGYDAERGIAIQKDRVIFASGTHGVHSKEQIVKLKGDQSYTPAALQSGQELVAVQ